MEWLIIFMPFVSLLINALSQIFMVRILAISILRSLLTGYLIGLVATFWCVLMLANKSVADTVGLILVNSGTYTALAYGYFVVIGLASSLRVRILHLIHQSQNGISPDELYKQFDGGGLLNRRMDRLVNNGQVRQSNEVIFSQPSPFLRLAQWNVRVKQFMLGKASELD